MQSLENNLSNLDDATLLAAVSRNVHQNREALVQLLIHLGEVDARKLYAREGYSSLFAFCQSLKFSESEAYKRCAVGRVGRRFPQLVEAIRVGNLHLTGAAMIAPKLNEHNETMLLQEARNKSKRALEAALLRLFPSPTPPQRAVIRSVGTAPSVITLGSQTEGVAESPASSSGSNLACAPVARVNAEQTQAGLAAEGGAVSNTAAKAQENSVPLSAPATTGPAVPATAATAATAAAVTQNTESHRLHVTLDASSYAMLRDAQDLLSHKLPRGDLGQIIGMALRTLVEGLLRQKHAQLKGRAKAEPSSQPLSQPSSQPSSQPLSQPLSQPSLWDAVRTQVQGSSSSRSEENATQNSASAARASACVASLSHPAPRSRTLSRAVKRAVYQRDGGACTYLAVNGHRCGSKTFLEYHHVHAFALGGCNLADNVTLHCRTHNALVAIDDFGLEHQMRSIGQRSSSARTKASAHSASFSGNTSAVNLR